MALNLPRQWKFDSAPAPYIIRAAEKDEFYKKHLYDDVEEVGTRLFGTRWVNKFEQELRLLAFAGYFILSAKGGRQTLGEEYCDLLQVHSTLLQPQSARRRVVQILLHLVAPYLLEKWFPVALQRLAHARPNRFSMRWYLPVKAFVQQLYRFHLAVFFISGAYYLLSSRATKTTMLLMNRPRSGLTSYTVLGWLILIQQAVEAVSFVRKTLRSRRAAAIAPTPAPEAGGEAEDEDEDDDDVSDAGRCSLCLGPRGKRNGITTATICGHLFCWNCVAGLCKSSPNPLCPLCRERITLQTLAPLYHYNRE
eukprot:TRINITY_DN2072_c0_g1_i1.p1 TRINITY_DN2072_c0_g1~~TRINITY_DN2072_c0_g1_i1.p1  ORF type:complete len:335 (+),score=137.14 TRINITY_DN2072_c0_g1_i1:83-1006(+)